MNKFYTEIIGIMLGVLMTAGLIGCTTSNNVIVTAAPTYCIGGNNSGYHYQHYSSSTGSSSVAYTSCNCPQPYGNSHSSFNSCCYRKATYPVYNQDSAAMVSTASYYYQYHK